MDPSDADWDRLLESACAPVEPPAPLRRRVLRRPSPGAWLPYLAGVATALLVAHGTSSVPATPAPSTVRFESIADRAPPPPLEAPATVILVPVSVLPRIS
jgi:hypothetical protein